MLLPAGALAQEAGDPEEQLEDVEQRLLETREDLEDIDERRALGLSDLERADAEVARLDATLAALQAELALAQRGLEESEQRLAATTSTLVATQERLDAARDELRHEREVFRERTRASFQFGGTAQMASYAFRAQDLADFGRALAYVERVMLADRDRVTSMAGLARQIEADTVELDVLQRRQASERAAAQQERDRVAGLLAREEELRAAAVAERQRRQQVVAQLDADRETHLRMVAELEEESQRLEDELRRIAEEEERRRREEERRRQEEERRRERERAVASRSDGGASAAGSAQPPPSTGQLQRPVPGRITSGYGWRTHPIFGSRRFHAGVDFSAGYGTPIHAAEAGVVVSAGGRGGYGLAVVIAHGGGLSTLYAHQSRVAVHAGQQVSRGQVIGYVGSTGYSTGPHLHFEVRVGGATRDPLGYL